MWGITLVSAVLLGLVVGRILNWLSGALVRAMEQQWADAQKENQLLVREKSLLGLIWSQRCAVGDCLRLKPSSKSSAFMSLGAAVLLACVVWFEASAMQASLVIPALMMLLMLRIDAEHFLLPDVLVYSLLWSGLMWAAVNSPTPEKAVIAAFCAYVGLYVLAEGYSALRGIQMMGHGDYKLFAALAAWLDYPLIPAMLLGACIAMIALWLHLYRKKLQAEMPFGPALIVSGGAFIAFSQPWAL